MLVHRRAASTIGALSVILIALSACGGGGKGSSALELPTQPLPPLYFQTETATPPGTRASALSATPSPAVDCSSETITADVTAATAPGSIAPVVPLSEVQCLVSAAPASNAVPKNLIPPLDRADSDYGLPDAKQCVADHDAVDVPDCVFGDRAGTRTVILLGDSFAFMWLPSFDVIGKRLHWKVILLSKSNCTPAYLTVYDPTRKTAFKQCEQWHQNAIARINQAHPDIVVLAGTTSSDETNQYFPKNVWANGIQKTLDLITIPKNKKVVLTAIPYPVLPDKQISGPECLAAHRNDLQRCVVTRDNALSGGTRDGDELGARQAGAQYIEPSPWFCSQVCSPVIGDMNVYVASGHLSATYGRYLSGVLQSYLEAIMDGA